MNGRMKLNGLLARARKAMHGARESLMEHAYLVTLGAVVAIIAASAMYTSHVRAQNEAGVQTAAGALETQGTAQPTAAASPRVTPLPTIAPLVVREEVLRVSAGTVWPASGEVIRAYEPDVPVLWEALSCVRVHPGVDIAGEPGEEVRCAADGVVEAVSRDELWGWRVRIAQTDGITAEYAGLATCALTEGESITRGQALGTLLEAVPCEAELGAHLHLEMAGDSGAVSPMQVLEDARR